MPQIPQPETVREMRHRRLGLPSIELTDSICSHLRIQVGLGTI